MSFPSCQRVCTLDFNYLRHWGFQLGGGGSFGPGLSFLPASPSSSSTSPSSSASSLASLSRPVYTPVTSEVPLPPPPGVCFLGASITSSSPSFLFLHAFFLSLPFSLRPPSYLLLLVLLPRRGVSVLGADEETEGALVYERNDFMAVVTAGISLDIINIRTRQVVASLCAENQSPILAFLFDGEAALMYE